MEWRALTVALLDRLAPLVRERLGAADLPLASILEGGTWVAGRRLADARRGGAAAHRGRQRWDRDVSRATTPSTGRPR